MGGVSVGRVGRGVWEAERGNGVGRWVLGSLFGGGGLYCVGFMSNIFWEAFWRRFFGGGSLEEVLWRRDEGMNR